MYQDKMVLCASSAYEHKFNVTSKEGDLLFDEIGSVLKIKEIRQNKEELLESLEMYYRVFYLGEDVDIEDK